jgi:hypothetical protein
MTREELIAALESATAEQQGHLILQALWLAHERGWITAQAGERAFKMLSVGAYESAALTLVPANRIGPWCIFDFTNSAKAEVDGEPGVGATPALALAAAALKAQGGAHG